MGGVICCPIANKNLTTPKTGRILSAMIEKDSTAAPALQRLQAWLSGDRTQKWLAEKLGVSRPTVYRWTIGEHAPDAHYRRAIHDLSKGVIHFDDWYTNEQLELAYAFSRTKRRRVERRRQFTRIAQLREAVRSP